MRYFVFALMILCVSSPLTAQPVSKILKNAEKALGGEKAFRAISSIKQSGTITRVGDGFIGKFVLLTAKPNSYYFKYDLRGQEVAEIAYNGRSGWLKLKGYGIKTLTGNTISDFQAKATHRNNLWLNSKTEKSLLVFDGRTEISGRAANVVRLASQKGKEIRIFIDSVTGLILKDEVPNDGFVEVTTYQDYREVGGIKLPYRQIITIDGAVYQLDIENIELNPKIDRSQFDFPRVAGEPLPDIRALLTELQANEDKVEGILDTYSYIQKQTSRAISDDGKIKETESETYQLSFYKGNRIRRLIEKNGKPLNSKDQAKEDEEVQKRVEEIEKQLAKKEKAEARNGPPDENSRRVSVAELLRASKLINPRRERFRGRDVIVFDFEPNPDFDYKNAKSMLKFFGKTAGVMWIDERDKQVARLEAFLAENFSVGGGVLAKLKKGASFVLEQDRINDEIWLPSIAEINLSARVLLLKGINLNQVVRSYDYKKFATEVEGAKVNAQRPI